MTRLPFALQLYTVRDHLQINPASTLRKVKGAGYDYVELAGTAGLDPVLFRKLLLDAGLKPVSAHMPYAQLIDDPKNAADYARLAAGYARLAAGYARLFEIDFVVAPMIDPALAPNRAAWLECGRALGGAAAELREVGVTLAYHNHAHEFTPVDGVCPIDLLIEGAAPERLALELDTYWIKYAGADPAAMLETYSGRCPLLHIKDMAGKSRAFAEVGRGVIDWEEVFEKGRRAGVQWYIVEQDTCPGDSIDSARTSAMYIREH